MPLRAGAAPRVAERAAQPSRARRAVRLLLLVATVGLDVVATALTVPRLMSTGSYRLAELASLTPLGMPVGAAALLAALGLVLASVRGSRRTATMLAGWSAALVVTQALWLAPLYLGKLPHRAPGATVTVLAQNLEYGTASSLLRAATANGADVLVVTDAGDVRRRLAGPELTSMYPYTLGVTGDDPGGVVVFSRFPIADDGDVFDGNRGRTARLQTPLGPVLLLAIHPAPPDDMDHWRADYTTLESFMRQRYRDKVGEPVILAGDLNATLDNAPLRRIRGFGLRDAVEQTNAGFRPTYPADSSTGFHGIPLPPLVQIDHVLCGGGIAAISYRHVRVHGTDHLGVLVELGPAR